MQQTFPADTAQRIIISHVEDELKIYGWDQQTIQITSKGEIGAVQPEGDALLINNCDKSLQISVPYETLIIAHDINDAVTIENVRGVELQEVRGDIALKTIQGDIRVKDIHGNAFLQDIRGIAYLGDIHGSLEVINVTELKATGNIRGDARLDHVAKVEAQKIHSDLALKKSEVVYLGHVGGDIVAEEVTNLHSNNVGGDCKIQGHGDSTIQIGNVGNDLTVRGARLLQIGNVGNDLQVKDCTQAEVNVGNVGDDLVIIGGAQVRIGNVGSDCQLQDITGDVHAGHVGSDLTCTGIGGNIHTGAVGSDAVLKGIHGGVHMSMIGSDFILQGDFPQYSQTNIRVGSDARIILPENPNVTLSARVQGDISGVGQQAFGHGNKQINLIYGTGAASVQLAVGGDLNILSPQEPKNVSRSNSSDWWNDFAQEMTNFGMELGRFGQDFAAEVTASVAQATSNLNDEFTNSINLRVKEQMQQKAKDNQSRIRERELRRNEELRRQAEKRARHEREHAARLNIRLNNREWSMDPERINRIIEQAQHAATEGIQGAMEAVEQALKNLSVTPPFPPTPPFPSTPPVYRPGEAVSKEQPGASEQAQAERNQPEIPVTPWEEHPQATKPTVNVEQEREAILRMIAEGRITPDEGDMLLEALEG